MALSSYGVLRARVMDRRREDSSSGSPHYQLHVIDAAGTSFRIAVNVLSQETPSELLYFAADDFRHPLTALLPTTGGWTALPSQPGAANLDFIRGNLFDPALMRALPPNLSGPDNDLADRLDHYTERAIATADAVVYVFGQRWGPESSVPDKIFGFRPGNGVHDIHMNQGNSARFRNDDGVWQDGGLLFQFPAESRWVGVFLAFQSQAWHTDDATGHAIGDLPPAPPAPFVGAAAVRIVAALVNPVGPAPEHESVTLLNASPDAVDLTGWRIADRMKRTCAAPEIELPPGGMVVVPLPAEVQLGNSGGAITLLDADGLKVDGVAYTADAARQEGWTVVF
jgi:uncharacterized protein YukJ